MRRSLRVLLPLIVAALALAACGNDESSSSKTSGDKPTTTVGSANTDSRAERIGQKVVNSDSMDTVDSEMQSCVGDAFIEAFDADAEKVAKVADDSSSDLTDAQRKVLVEALDTCIPGDAFASFYMSTVYEQAGLGDTDPAAVECLAGKVDGKVGQVAAAFNDSPDSTPEEFMNALDACVPQSAVAGLIRAGLAKAGADGTPLTAAQADCVTAAVAPKLKFSQLAKGDTTELQALIQASVTSCPG